MPKPTSQTRIPAGTSWLSSPRSGAWKLKATAVFVTCLLVAGTLFVLISNPGAAASQAQKAAFANGVASLVSLLGTIGGIGVVLILTRPRRRE